MTEEAQSEEYGKYGLLKIGENDLLIKKGVIKFPESADDRPCLIGSKCKSCGDVSYPSRYFCPKCGSEGEEFHFGAFGEIISIKAMKKAVHMSSGLTQGKRFRSLYILDSPL